MRLEIHGRLPVLIAGSLLLILLVNAAFFAVGEAKRRAEVSSRAQPLLRIAVWEDYIAPDNIEEFFRKHKCRVEITTFKTNDELIDRLTLEGSRFDVIVPSSYVIPRLRSMRVLARMDRTRLRNAYTIDSRIDALAGGSPDNELIMSQFGVPFVVAPTGIAASLDAGLSATELSTWKIFERKDLVRDGKKRLTLLHDMRETFAAALLANGHSVNATDDRVLREAQKTIRRWLQVADFNDDSYAAQLAVGSIDIAHAYPGDVGYIRGGARKVEFLLPREGSSISIEYICIIRGTPQEDLAYEFIDHMLAPASTKKNIDWSHIRCASTLVWESYRKGPSPPKPPSSKSLVRELEWKNPVPYELDEIPAERVLQPLSERVYRGYELLWSTLDTEEADKEQP